MENKINLDIEINKQILNEDLDFAVKRIIELWLEYDYELLALIKEDDVNE